MPRDEICKALAAAVREPKAWLYEADRLKRAADLVGTQFQAEANTWLKSALRAESEDELRRDAAFSLAPAYLMLAGYAVEDLAKGLIVASDQSDEAVKWITTKHLSAQMMRRATVELLDGERDLVERLSHRITWAGRYPAPHLKEATAFAESVRKRGWWGNPMRVSTGDVRMVNELFDRMRQLLGQ